MSSVIGPVAMAVGLNLWFAVAAVTDLSAAPAAEAVQEVPLAEVTVEELLYRGFAAYSLGRYADTLKMFDEIRRRGPEALATVQWPDSFYFVYAMARLFNGDAAGAGEFLGYYWKTYPKGKDAPVVGFIYGVTLLQGGKPAEAFAVLNEFASRFPGDVNAPQARLLAATALVQEKKYAEVVKFLEPWLGKLRPDLDSQAHAMFLQALIETRELERAVKLATDYRPDREGATRLSAFHLLSATLGDRLRSEGKLREALAVYQRIWTRQRLIKRVREAMAKIALEIAAVDEAVKLGKDLSASSRKAHLERVRQDLSADLKTIEAAPDFDIALALRKADVYLELGRDREAAILLRNAVNTLPPSELLIQAWYQLLSAYARMEAWPTLYAGTGEFLEANPKAAIVPEVLYLRGQAAEGMGAFADAVKAYSEIAEKHPAHSLAARAHFMAAYVLMSMDRNAEALAMFDAHGAKFPKSVFLPDVAYWKGMAMLYDGRWAESREQLGRYQEQTPAGGQVSDSRFRRAYCVFREKKYEQAADELNAFLSGAKDPQLRDEANNLLGDSLLAIGRSDEAMDVYWRTTDHDPVLRDYAAFRIGRTLRALQDNDAAEKHFRDFIANRPDSPRVPEALAQIAAIERLRGRTAEVRALYWDAIARYGNDPDRTGVEQLMEAAAKLSVADGEKEQLLNKARVELEKARAEKKLTLEARLSWLLWLATRKDPNSPANAYLGRIAWSVPFRKMPPLVLADVADRMLAAGELDQARKASRTLVSWWPRSIEAGRGWANLGLIALREGRHQDAISLFDRYERMGAAPDVLPQILENRAAALVALNRPDEAISALERLTTLPQSRGLPTANALLKIGDIHAAAKNWSLAIPYYQRVYVLYRRHAEQVARAYAESAKGFDALGRSDEAKRTREELLSQQDLQETGAYIETAREVRRVN